MASLHCTVATPTRELFSGDIAYANVPGAEGCYGVLPGHEIMVALNKSGGVLTINLDDAGTDKRMFILYEGATQVYEDHITVLGRFGKDVNDINADELHEQIETLSAHVEELEKSDEDDKQARSELETARAELEWCQMQLDYAQAPQS